MDEIEYKFKKGIEEMNILFDSDVDCYQMKCIFERIIKKKNIVFIFHVNYNVIFGIYFVKEVFSNDEESSGNLIFYMKDNDLKFIKKNIRCCNVQTHCNITSKLVVKSTLYLCSELDKYGNTCSGSLGSAIRDSGVDFEYFPDFEVHRVIIGEL